jgi:PAS domain S-box-containing protein
MSLDSVKLLLIEDDTVDQLAFKRFAANERLPLQFDIVRSVAEAAAALKRGGYDIIVSDYHLGDGTALDVCEIAGGIPLVIITGAGNEEIAVKALKSGVSDYLIKDPERKYLKILPLTLEKTVNSSRADKQMKMLLHAIMHISDSVYITDVHGLIRFVNSAFQDTYGYTAAEVFGKPATILGNGGESGECIHTKKDGTRFFVSLSKSIVKDGNGNITAIVAVARDITERKRVEEALRASEEKYRKFFDEDLAGAFISTPDGKLLSCNRSFARIFGFDSVDDALNYNLVALYPRSRLFAEILDLVQLNRKLEHYEIQLRRRDGTPVYIIQNVIGKFDAQGSLVEIKGYVFDNTRHKLLEEQLRQAQKMEGIGTLAGGIAHDFNNILAIIMGHTHLLMNGNAELIKKAQCVETIDRAVKRGAMLVKQILTFARRNEAVFEPINLNTIIEDLHKMLAETFPKKIEFVLKLDRNLPTTIADQNQVHQALLNLCVNARDAMPSGGSLTIETTLTRGMDLRQRHPGAYEHLYIAVRVTDTGHGMPPEVLNRMFEPFFTTKEIGNGTGLGLAVVYGVTKGHKGFVEVSSEVGKGTTFTLYFPIRKEEATMNIDEQSATSDTTTNTGTILVVEDEQMLLELVRDLLEGKGYKVLTATDGEEAVEIYASRKEEIGLVITDLGLPKVDGWEAFQRMKELNPDVKVVVASGYIDETLRENLLKGGASDLVGKPYMAHEIVNRVRELMGSGMVAAA